jgi:hypothetical protein
MSKTDDRTEMGRTKTVTLLHYGVKGMRWGVRRSRAPTSVTVSQKGRKRLKAIGGENQPASSDAVKTKTLGQVAKKSGYQALTNEDLKSYTNRLNLEQNAKRLDYANKNPAKKFVASLLGKTGKSAAEQAANEVASKQVKKMLARGAVTAAAVAV